MQLENLNKNKQISYEIHSRTQSMLSLHLASEPTVFPMQRMSVTSLYINVVSLMFLFFNAFQPFQI